MKQRNLGNSGMKVSAIGLGCMSMSGSYGPADDDESIAVLHFALDQGINFLDSADRYGNGHNEELLGKVLRDRRGEVVLASKFGNTPDGVTGKPEYVQQACEASLKRLGVNVIDLYYQHRVDPVTPIEDTVGAMSRLVEQGKVRALGLSEAAPETIRRAHAVHPITAVQSEYSVMYREPAESCLPTCRALNITFVPYSPLGRSMLTGTLHSSADISQEDRRLVHPRFQEENLQQNLKLSARLDKIAEEKGIKTTQLVLAWLLAQGEDIVPIPGTKRRNYLAENLGAMEVVLDGEDLTRIAEAMPAAEVAGARYPEGAMDKLQI